MRRSPSGSFFAGHPLAAALTPIVVTLAALGLSPIACARGLEGEADAGGQGGAGGQGSATGKVASTAAAGSPASTSGNTASNSSGFGGSLDVSSSSGFGGSPNGPVSSTTAGPGPAVASSSSGGMGCDNTGNCMTCNICANNNDCAGPLAACMAQPECLQFAMCIAACNPNDLFCISDCELNYPNGEITYLDYDTCVICMACYNDCMGAAAGC